MLRTRLPVAVLVAIIALLVSAPAAAEPSPVAYQPPVDARVIDPYRAPPGPYAAGNRGIEYATAPGAPVLAAGDGTVSFAGVVAQQQWVALTHADGLRTTVGPLGEVLVAAGQKVERGELLGRADAALLFTVRRGDEYIDPAAILGGAAPVVHLAPEQQIDARVWERVESRNAGVASFGRLPVPPLSAPRVLWTAAGAVRDWWSQRRRCTRSSISPVRPPGRRLAVLVGGLGSSSDRAAVDGLDLAGLGYARADAVRFSYNGGRTPGPAAPELAGLPAERYAAADTLGDLHAAAVRLADVLAAVADAAPADAAVDVLAHSQGGVIARLALARLDQRRPDVLTRLGVVVTFASPHRGAPLAGAVSRVAANPLRELGLEAVQEVSGTGIEPDAEAVRQLAPGSEVITELDGLRPPASVRFVSIAARGDIVVPPGRARVDGATNVVLSVEGLDDHAALPSTPAAAREVALAMAGLPPTCRSLVDGLVDALVGDVVDNVEGVLSG
jgi:hypothetical protein